MGMTSAGYSGTPLHRKLGVKAGHRLLLVAAPDGFDAAQLDPDGTAVIERASSGAHDEGPYDVLLVFCPDAAALAARLPAAMAATSTAGRCWVAWPKRSSGRQTDLDENAVRDAALAVGWVDVKVCAVDGIWSGLCLVRRLSNREGTR
jgi:hypothetical protein